MTFREVEKMLKRDGWYYYDIVGSHVQYKHPTKLRENNFTKTFRRYKERNFACNIEAGRFTLEWRIL